MHTVLSAFDGRDAARLAADRLVQEGFAREDVHLRARDEGEDAQDDRISSRTIASPEREVAIGRHAMSALDHFFDHMLGRGEHAAHAHTYSEAVRRGGTVVVVDAASQEQADKDAAILQDAGAYDLAERTEQWREDGWSGVAAAGEQRLEGGGVVRWRTAHVVHRPSQPPLRDIVGSRQDKSDKR